MSVADAAWLAGFFDGEGYLNFHWGGRNLGSRCWSLHITNTNKEALRKCQKICGVGRFIKRKPKNPNHKIQWKWVVYKQRDIASILRQISDFLSVKNVQSKKFFDNWTDL